MVETNIIKAASSVNRLWCPSGRVVVGGFAQRECKCLRIRAFIEHCVMELSDTSCVHYVAQENTHKLYVML